MLPLLTVSLKHTQFRSVMGCDTQLFKMLCILLLQVVIEVCKKYLPSMSRYMNDQRVTQHVGDGLDFIEKHAKEFDVIITDSSDPDGMCTS